METKKVLRFASVKDILNAGLVPSEGNVLKNQKTGVAVGNHYVQSYAGRILNYQETGHAEFPVTIDGTIFSKEVVFLPVRTSKVKTTGGAEKEITLFQDGSALLWDGSIVEASEAAKLAGGVSPEKI